MIAKLLLTFALLGTWVYVLTQSGISRLIRMPLYFVIVAGIYFVWLPEQATSLANKLGIGRGADLIFYTWNIISFGVLINVHLKLRRNLNLVTQLARHIAMVQPYSGPSDSPSCMTAEGNGSGVAAEKVCQPEPRE